MFPDQITLKINKRLKYESDKQKLISLKKDIFDLNKKPIDTLRNHGIKIVNDINCLNSVKTTKNICLFNFRCDQVNKHIATKVIKREGFYEGLEIVLCANYIIKHPK